MISYVFDYTGLIISILGLILVLRSDILEKRSRRYFLWIFSILIAYALSDAVSWMTYEKAGRGWILASKTALFLESVFSCALIPLLSGFLLYSAGEERVSRNRIFQMILSVFAIYIVLLIYAQFSTIIYYYDELNIYHRGPWYPVLLILSILMSALNIRLLWNNRNLLSKEHKAVFLSCILIPVISMIIQMFFYGISIIILGASIADFIMLLYVINDHRKRYYMQQVENNKLKTEILLSQIQPHFLFNTLGTISYLCADAPEAKKAIGLFSRYLRGHIDVLLNEMLIPFDKETDHVRMYLELEKLRFGDSLQVSWDLSCTDFKIPSLSLQPLVENAVRYGVRENADGCGTVQILSKEYIIHDPAFLSQKSAEATKADLAIAEDLLDTLKAHWDHCSFLSANMIGKRKRIIAFCNGPLFVIMLNPQIICQTGEYESEEGCPSLEGKRKAKRYASIVVTWQDTEMKQRTGTINGFAAQLVQHAIDHCNGILI